MALMLNMAMEDEEPIPDYSRQSGEGFRFLLPSLARYMGKNQEEARFAAEHGLPWCEGAWCAEERRHSNTLARMIERLMKKPPRRDNPNRPMVVTASEADAMAHLLSRQTTEWNASSSYIVMAAHANGNLHGLIRNLERDEVKHLAILSAAAAYLLGPRPWKRFAELVRKGIENYQIQRKSRSGGDALGTNPVTAIEGIAAHLLVEFRLRTWLKTVPLRTLMAVFENSQEHGRQERLGLVRWSAERRRQAEEQGRFELSHEDGIRQMIEGDLDGFRGGELPGSDGDARLRRRIAGMKGAVRHVLLERLRDWQIQQHQRAPSSSDRSSS